jgi:hypothetical protein
MQPPESLYEPIQFLRTDYCIIVFHQKAIAQVRFFDYNRTSILFMWTDFFMHCYYTTYNQRIFPRGIFETAYPESLWIDCRKSTPAG